MCGLDQETKRYYRVILWILIYHRVAKTSNYVLLHQLFYSKYDQDSQNLKCCVKYELKPVNAHQKRS